MTDDTIAGEDKPLYVLRPRTAWLPAHPRELWDFRELMWRFAARDITLRYRQTALGVVWVVLQPLMTAAILAYVFHTVANLPGPPGIPYFLFTLVGMTAWNTFSNTVTRSSSALVSNAALVQKVFFPRLLLPISTVISTMVDLGVSLALVLILMLVYGVAPGLSLLAMPACLLLFVFISLGVGLATGALMVRYRDVSYVLPVVVQFLLFASPVGYELSSLPNGSRLFYELNPLTGLLELFRWSMLNTPLPPTWVIAYSGVVSCLALVVGVGVFTRMEKQFADVI